MDIKDLIEGLEVVYIPQHIENPYESKEVEYGVISSWNGSYIFVKYDGQNSQATSIKDLQTKEKYDSIKYLVKE